MKILGHIIQDWATETNTKIFLNVNYFKKEIWVYSTRPGVLIGLQGATVYKYENEIHKLSQYKDYSVKIGGLQEEFIPGTDYDKVVEEKMNAYFEYEDYYSWFDEAEGDY